MKDLLNKHKQTSDQSVRALEVMRVLLNSLDSALLHHIYHRLLYNVEQHWVSENNQLRHYHIHRDPGSNSEQSQSTPACYYSYYI